ncbi:MAG: hypothetical protein D6799_07245, partial [Bacteroidetes bacterium]
KENLENLKAIQQEEYEMYNKILQEEMENSKEMRYMNPKETLYKNNEYQYESEYEEEFEYDEDDYDYPDIWDAFDADPEDFGGDIDNLLAFYGRD